LIVVFDRSKLHTWTANIRGLPMKYFITLLAATFLCACSVPRSVKEGGTTAGRTIDPAGKVLILSVGDGQEQGQSPAVGSGQGMVAALRMALGTHGVPLSTTSTATLNAGFDEAKKDGFDYVLLCNITLWEDNATAWSGKGDKLSISVQVFDTQSHALVAAATHNRVATGFTLAAGTPDRFEAEVAKGALSKIYGWPAED
jgi:hypothetical protein